MTRQFQTVTNTIKKIKQVVMIQVTCNITLRTSYWLPSFFPTFIYWLTTLFNFRWATRWLHRLYIDHTPYKVTIKY